MTADESSIAEWQASIQSRLEAALPGVTADPLDRVRWVAQHLAEYIDRWVGFVEHPAVADQPSSFAFASGFFAVVGAGANLLARESASATLPARAREVKDTLLSVYARLEDERDLSLRQQLQEVGSQLCMELTARG